jgi:hypothetical protein
MAQLIDQHDSFEDDVTWFQAYGVVQPQRLFWMYGVAAQQARGGHRHPEGRMLLRCLVGSVLVYIQSPQADSWYRLSDPGQRLLVDAQDWRLMYNFSADAVLLVMAETTYAHTRYIDEPYRPLAMSCPEVESARFRSPPGGE